MNGVSSSHSAMCDGKDCTLSLLLEKESHDAVNKYHSIAHNNVVLEHERTYLQTQPWWSQLHGW